MNNRAFKIFLWYLVQNCDESFEISWHLYLDTLINLTINDFSKDAVVFVMYNHHFPSYGLHYVISFQNSFPMFITIIFCTLQCFTAQKLFPMLRVCNYFVIIHLSKSTFLNQACTRAQNMKSNVSNDTSEIIERTKLLSKRKLSLSKLERNFYFLCLLLKLFE